MSDSSRHLTSEASVDLPVRVLQILAGIPVKTKKTTKQMSYMSSLGGVPPSRSKTSYPDEDHGTLSRLSSMNYAQILIEKHPLNMLLEKFNREAEHRKPRAAVPCATVSTKQTPVTVYRYTRACAMEGTLVLLKSRLQLHVGGKVRTVRYSAVAGVLAGPCSSTFQQWRATVGLPSGFCLSLVLASRTVDLSFHSLPAYLAVYLRLTRSIEKRVQHCLPLPSRCHLLMLLVRSKLVAEAQERHLSLGQLFILGMITVARRTGAFSAEFALTEILAKTLTGLNRFYHVTRYAAFLRKHHHEPLRGRHKKEWRRFVLLNAKRYWNYRRLLGRPPTDQGMTRLLAWREARLSTVKMFMPSLQRLFRHKN